MIDVFYAYDVLELICISARVSRLGIWLTSLRYNLITNKFYSDYGLGLKFWFPYVCIADVSLRVHNAIAKFGSLGDIV